AAHSSTSISAGLGMAVARGLKGDDRQVIAVIGDGALSAGMAYGAMNNAGAHRAPLGPHGPLPVAAHFLTAFPVPAGADGEDGAPLPAANRAGGSPRRR